jgi:Amt family ammonium transporter
MMWASAAILALLPSLAQAQEPTLNPGDTAWMLTSSVLVLFMTLPGLALFYGGLVRSKNVLSVLIQCFAIAGLISVLWAIYGYTMAFDATGMVEGAKNLHAFVGGFGKLFLKGVGVDSLSGSIPETVFAMFQLTFAIITPALIIGAFAERMKFSAMLLFMGLWFTLVYLPICHMVWGGKGAYLADLGVLDFAGGTVVHINAGIAALISVLVIGKRVGFPTTAMPPHNMTLTVTGAAMLWVGWFGFNAGSALTAGGLAGMAMLVTHLAAATAALSWVGAEWVRHGKPTTLGVVSGAVAGLVAITPASGTVGPMGAIAIGFAAGVACFLSATSLKRALGYDDALDAFGVHGVGGFLGAVLTGVFAYPSLGGHLEPTRSMLAQVGVQLYGSIITVVYCGIVTFIILKAIDATLGLRVATDQERAGLDLSDHDESGYNL